MEDDEAFNDYIDLQNDALALKNAEAGSYLATKYLVITPQEQYRRTAGEVEARNVQSRMNMSAAERLATLLAETEDVRRADQIILDKASVSYCQNADNAEKIRVYGQDYTDGKTKGVKAIEKLLETKDGFISNAFYKDGIGDIDVVYGKITNAKKHKGYGLAHIFDKHPNITPEIMAEVIEKGTAVENYNGFNIIYDDYILGINRGYREN